MQDTDIQTYLRRAVDLSRTGMDEGIGGPFGCVIVKEGIVIAEGSNRVTSDNDPTAHAEVVAIRKACQALGDFLLTDCLVFCSCEPCPMCLGAIYWARPRAVYYANTKEDAAAIGFDDALIYKEILLAGKDRSIRFIHVSVPGAREVFDAWKEKRDKNPY